MTLTLWSGQARITRWFLWRVLFSNWSKSLKAGAFTPRLYVNTILDSFSCSMNSNGPGQEEIVHTHDIENWAGAAGRENLLSSQWLPVYIFTYASVRIGGFHVTSSPPCWWTVNKRSLISSLCLSTSICSFHHCYLCLLRLHENHLYLYSRCSKVCQRLPGMWRSTFEICAVQPHSVTEIMSTSPLLFVNRRRRKSYPV